MFVCFFGLDHRFGHKCCPVGAASRRDAALWERRPAAIISDMMCKYRGETPLSQRWMAETMIKAGF
jgi:hypothetical protein